MELKPVESIRSLKTPLKEVVILDTSWHLHRNYHAYSLSVTLDGVETPTGDIYGVLRSVQSVVKKKPFAAVIFAIDAKDPDKMDLDPNYKANRKEHGEVYAKLEEILQSASVLPNVFISGAPRKEADEVIFTLAQSFSAAGIKATIYANDKDMHQAITNERVTQFWKILKGKPQEMTVDDVKFKWGLNPNRIPFYRAVRGDDSDNLKGYERFPDKLLLEIATEFETPKQFLDSKFSADRPSLQKYVDLLRNEPDVLIRNFEIMNLTPIEDLQIFKGEGTWEFMDKYQMRGTKAAFSQFMKQAD